MMLTSILSRSLRELLLYLKVLTQIIFKGFFFIRCLIFKVRVPRSLASA